MASKSVVTPTKVKKHAKFGKELKISPKSYVGINEAGFKIEFFVPTAEILIGIGKDEVATLIMAEDAWNAIKSGEPINIPTLSQFKKQIGG